MAKVLIGTYRSTTLAQNTTNYLTLAMGKWVQGTSGEAGFQRTVRTAGVVSLLYTQVTANSIAATPSATYTFRKGGADQTLTFTVTSTGTGEFIDTSHSVTLVAGDLINSTVVTGASGANTIRPRINSVAFQASSNTSVWHLYSTSTQWNTASVTNFTKPIGSGTTVTSETTTQQFKAKVAGTRKNLSVGVATNTSAANGTYRSRLNGSNGALVATITLGVTGTYEDTTHSDTIAVNDLYNNSFTTGAGSTDFGFPLGYCDFETTDRTAQLGGGATMPYAQNTTAYDPMQGDIAKDATETNVQSRMGVAGVLDKFEVFVSANTVALASTTTSRVAAGAGNGSITITALTAGWYEDTTHSDTVTATQLVDFQTVVGIGGTSETHDMLGAKFTSSSTPALAVTTQPSNVNSGAANSPATVVKTTLDGTNVDGTFTGVVTVAIATGSGVLSGTLTATAVAGVATFSNIIITGSGAHTLSFTAPGGWTTVNSSSFTVTGAAASVMSVQPTNVASAIHPIAPSVVVNQTTDGSTVDTSFQGNVVCTKATGTGALSGTLTVAAVNGVATFANLIITGSGAHTLTFTAAGYTAVTSSSFTVTTPAVSITTQPSDTTSGAVMSNVVAKATLDGTVVDTAFTGNITVSSAGGTATLGGTLTVAAVAGVATFTNIIPTTAGSGNSLSIVATGYTTATSNTYVVNAPASPASIVGTQPPASVTSGVVISPAVVFKATTNGVTVDTSFNGTCVVTIATGTGSLTGATVACVNGVATMSTLALTGDGPGYTLTGTMSGYTAVTTASFTCIGTATAANQTLIAALGGNSLVPAVYDCRLRQTLTSSKVSGWDDAVGTLGGRTAGPQLAQGTAGSRPTPNATLGIDFASASTQHLLSAQDTRFTQDADAPLYVITIAKATGAGFVAGVASDPTALTTYPFIYTKAGSTNWQGDFGATASGDHYQPDTGVAFNDGAIRLTAMGKTQHVGASIFQPGDERYQMYFAGRQVQLFMSQAAGATTIPVATTTTGGQKLAVGRGGSTYFDGTVYWVGYLTGPMTMNAWKALIAFAQTQFGITLANDKRNTFVVHALSGYSGYCVDDQSGHLTPTPQTGTKSVLYVCANSSSGARGSFVTQGLDVGQTHSYLYCKDGINSLGLEDGFDTLVAPNIDGMRAGSAILLYLSIYNDLSHNNWSGATALTHLATYAAKCRALGILVCLETCADGSNFYTANVLNTLGQAALDYNTGIRATVAGGIYYDVLLDLEAHASNLYKINASPRSYTNPTAAVYSSDSAHFSIAYQAIHGQYWKDIFDANDSILYPATSGNFRLDRTRRGIAAGVVG